LKTLHTAVKSDFCQTYPSLCYVI